MWSRKHWHDCWGQLLGTARADLLARPFRSRVSTHACAQRTRVTVIVAALLATVPNRKPKCPSVTACESQHW